MVRVPPKLMARPATRPARTASRTRSTPWPWPAQRCASRTCRSPGSTVPRARDPAAGRSPGRPGRRSEPGCISRLRWHLHELDPAWSRAAGPDAQRALDAVEPRPRRPSTGLVAADRPRARRALPRAARSHPRRWSRSSPRVTTAGADAASVPGCGALTAAKIIGETAGVDRFRSDDAYARYNGTAPLPVWSSGNRPGTGSAAPATANSTPRCTASRSPKPAWHPAARTMLERRQNSGNSGREALRILKRRLSDVVYRTLLADAV